MQRTSDSDEPQQARKRFKPDFHDVVKVLVGESEAQFTLHTDHICAKSPFLKAACSEKWKEGQEKVIKLPEVEPQIFKIYVNWVYSDTIDIDLVDGPSAQYCRDHHGHTGDSTSAYRRCLCKARSHRYCALYATADMLLDEKAKVATMDKLIALDREKQLLLYRNETEFVWANTSSGCALRRLALDIWATRISLAKAKELWPHVPQEFKAELAMRMMEVKVGPQDRHNPRNASRCHYHDHEDGARCD